MNLSSPVVVIVFKLLLAILCGGMIGLERELKLKPAGLRTNMLICMAAAMLMVVSRHIGSGAAYTDPARLVAQVITGVGFIGAGVIIRSRGSVTGLTTAATIFIVTVVGIAIGDGLYMASLLMTVLIIGVLALLRPLENAIVRRRRIFHYTFKTSEPQTAYTAILRLAQNHALRLEDLTDKDLGDGSHEISLSVVTTIDGHHRINSELQKFTNSLKASTHGETD